jgi:hypothetical protein
MPVGVKIFTDGLGCLEGKANGLVDLGCEGWVF